MCRQLLCHFAVEIKQLHLLFPSWRGRGHIGPANHLAPKNVINSLCVCVQMRKKIKQSNIFLSLCCAVLSHHSVMSDSLRLRGL